MNTCIASLGLTEVPYDLDKDHAMLIAKPCDGKVGYDCGVPGFVWKNDDPEILRQKLHKLIDETFDCFIKGKTI